MLFLGNSFFAADFSLDPTPTNANNTNDITLSNGIYDDLFVTTNINQDLSSLTWDFGTILHAYFNGTLSAGNADFVLEQVDTMIIKRRKINTFDWMILYEIPITDYEDFAFERLDKYNRHGVEYEYALVPSLAGIEGSYNINTIVSEMYGMFIVERDQTFNTILEYQANRQRNIANSIVETIDSKYPYIVNHSKQNYDSGSASGVFIELDYDNCELKIKEGYNYRDNLMEFLGNGNAKILKLDDGRMFMVSIINQPTESQESTTEKFTTAFDWAEIGDAEDGRTLWRENFIDIMQ